MPFPSTLSTFNRPTTTDRLNSPSHSALHNTVSSALGQVEAVIGVDGPSSVVGTMMYDLRSPASGGGGHVQVANKGGTGQTTFTKGDILVAQSSSVISKLAIGSNDAVLTADSTTNVGIKWAAKVLPKVGVSGSVLSYTNSSTETSIISVTVPGSTLGTNNALRGKLFIRNLNAETADSLTIKGHYGGTSIATIIVASIQAGVGAAINGTIDINIIAGNATNSQVGTLETNLYPPVPFSPTASFLGMKRFVLNTIAVDSDAPQTIGITAKWNRVSPDADLDTNGFIIDKIT